MLPLVVIRLHIKAVCQSVREATTASGVDNAASQLADTQQTGLFHPLEIGLYAKTTGRNPSILMSSADRVAHIDGPAHAIIVSNTHALPAEYKCLK